MDRDTDVGEMDRCVRHRACRRCHGGVVNTAGLNYPVLTIARSGLLATIGSEQALRTCNARGLKARYFESLRIIDSSGASFIVGSAKKVRLLKGGLRLLIGSGVWLVELDLTQGEAMGLADVRKVVTEAMRRLPQQWTPAGPLEEAVRLAEEAPTLKDLMQLFTGFF
jgi:hypothetical protein